MKGQRMIVTAALIVAGIRLWMQMRGKTKTPFPEWAIGWGALFLLLSLGAEISPEASGMLALTVVVGDFLMNGTSLFNDVTSSITDAQKGKGVFSATPFSGAPTVNPATKGAAK